jgi:hypothetical protein
MSFPGYLLNMVNGSGRAGLRELGKMMDALCVLLLIMKILLKI